jgi:hypothetical protein
MRSAYIHNYVINQGLFKESWHLQLLKRPYFESEKGNTIRMTSEPRMTLITNFKSDRNYVSWPVIFSQHSIGIRTLYDLLRRVRILQITYYIIAVNAFATNLESLNGHTWNPILPIFTKNCTVISISIPIRNF